eukprot:CAMPEP_0119523358 /NCGR_PEP_ID=MMETSP1344-20130328/38439_1 /TAXON_ID=236787 /ORGANISM="Florenciella parvula, Strain CCMP2471" /LENGTH=61 /DNA_ID=CAMNT_0007561557 /DNA_START=153 /DNA_END=335 /DNA_ORIENTATION=-
MAGAAPSTSVEPLETVTRLQRGGRLQAAAAPCCSSVLSSMLSSTREARTARAVAVGILLFD